MRYRCLLTSLALTVVATHELRAQVRPPEVCTPYETAVRANPNDVLAAVNLGRCSVRDYEMIAPDGDSTRLRFRSDWTLALRALRQAVKLDPANGRAYRSLFRMLFAETRDGCSHVTTMCTHVSSVIRDGDSLITVPRRVPELQVYSDSMIGKIAERETIARQRPSLEEALALAERWVSVAPNEFGPHEYRGRALLRLDQFEQAAEAMERAAILGTAASRRQMFEERFEALVKAARGADARRALDEAAADPGRDTMQLRSYTLASFNSLVGRHLPPPVDTAAWRRARAQMRIDSTPRPPLVIPPREPSFRELLAAGDTVAARRALARLDSMMTPPAGTFSSHHYPGALDLARNYLAVGDTARAEAKLAYVERPFHEKHFHFSHAISMAYGYSNPWVGRAWLLMGDVAAKRGRADEAVRMYRRVIGLWGGGDADLQPVVTEARVKLDSLTRR